MHRAQKAMWWLLLPAVLVGLVLPACAQAPVSGCNVSLDQVRLANPLVRFAHGPLFAIEGHLSFDTGLAVSDTPH